MDRTLKKVTDGIAALAVEVREGEFLERIPPGTAETWTHNGLVLAGRHITPFTIVTPYAREAGALLDSIRELFTPLLDECIEQDFLDRIREAAIEYSGYADRTDQTAVNLLKILMAEAESILEEMRDGEFPYTTNGTVPRQGEEAEKEEKG